MAFAMPTDEEGTDGVNMPAMGGSYAQSPNNQGQSFGIGSMASPGGLAGQPMPSYYNQNANVMYYNGGFQSPYYGQQCPSGQGYAPYPQPSNFSMPQYQQPMQQNPIVVQAQQSLKMLQGCQNLNQQQQKQLLDLICEMLVKNKKMSDADLSQSTRLAIQQNESRNKRIIDENSDQDPFKGKGGQRITVTFSTFSNSFTFRLPINITFGEVQNGFFKYLDLSSDSQINFLYNSINLSAEENKTVQQLGLQEGCVVMVNDPQGLIVNQINNINQKKEQSIVKRDEGRRKCLEDSDSESSDEEEDRDRDKVNNENIGVEYKGTDKEMVDMLLLSEIKKQQITGMYASGNNLLDIDKAIQRHKEMKGTKKTDPKVYDEFMVGILAKYLHQLGCKVAISAEAGKGKENDNLISTTLQYLINGLVGLHKFIVSINFPLKSNEKGKYIKNFREKLSKRFGINLESIIATFPNQSTSPLLLVIKEKHSVDAKGFANFFKENKDLGEMTALFSVPIVDGFILNPSMHAYKGDNADKGKHFGYGKWGENEKRANETYYPPHGWYGYGLTVFDRYDSNNDWLGYEGGKEWTIAYAGAFEYENADIRALKMQYGQGGLVCSPHPDFLDKASGLVFSGNTEWKIGFMLRVKPNVMKKSNDGKLWVVNGNSSEVRPYRILIKSNK